MIILAVAGLALRLLCIFAFGDLAAIVALGHQVRHFEDHWPVVWLLSLAPAALPFAGQWLRVLVVVQLRIVHRVVVVVRVQLRYWLQLRTVVVCCVLVGALVRICAWYRVTRVDVIESHVALLLLLGVRYRSIHGFYWQLGIELTAG